MPTARIGPPGLRNGPLYISISSMQTRLCHEIDRACVSGVFLKREGVFPAQMVLSASLLVRVCVTFTHLLATGAHQILLCHAKWRTLEYRTKKRQDMQKSDAALLPMAPSVQIPQISVFLAIEVLCVPDARRITCACSVRACHAKAVIHFWRHSVHSQ